MIRLSSFALPILFLNSQLFFSMGQNPAGIVGVEEAAVVAIFLYISLRSIQGNLGLFDIKIIFSVFTLNFCSAFFSYLRFDQPILYGMIEARAFFAILAYMPVLDYLKRHGLEYLFQVILGIALFCMIIGCTWYFNIIPKSFFPNTIEYGENSLRDGRFTGGRYFIYFAPFISLHLIRNGLPNKYWHIFIFYASIAYVAFILQERQVLFSQLFSLLILFLLFFCGRYSIRVMKIFIPAVALSTLAIFLMIDSFAYVMELNLENLLVSKRAVSYLTVIETLTEHGFLVGNGSVWGFWNGGFERIYGYRLSLGDIGLVGSIYRFGLPISLIVYFYFFYFLYRFYFKFSNAGKEVVVSLLMTTVLTLPVSAPLEYRGYYLSIFLAILIFTDQNSERSKK